MINYSEETTILKPLTEDSARGFLVVMFLIFSF